MLQKCCVSYGSYICGIPIVLLEYNLELSVVI